MKFHLIIVIHPIKIVLLSMIHPSSYKSTLKRIYNTQDGYNVDGVELFEYMKHLLESNILNYEDFILEHLI